MVGTKGALNEDASGADVLRRTSATPGPPIVSLMAELTEDHIGNHLPKDRHRRKRPKILIEIVRTYLKRIQVMFVRNCQDTFGSVSHPPSAARKPATAEIHTGNSRAILLNSEMRIQRQEA